MNGAEALRAFLAERHEACPGCGYDLHALRAERCPECDLALELRVNLVEPDLGLWIAVLVGASAGIGFHAGILGIYSWMLLLGMFTAPAANWVLLGVGLGLGGAMVWAAVRWRGWYRLRSRGVRIVLTVGSWGVSIAGVVGFCLLAS